ncbi:hypothetical protein U1Q18_020213 [Sarracenia purpurea var. burkii]
METLVVVTQHRNEYYSRSRVHSPARFGSFESFPSRGFKDINCRTFQSGVGILPTPLKAGNTTVTKRACSSPKTPSPSVKSYPGESEYLKRKVKNITIPIPINIKADRNKEGVLNDEFPYSELWAGPAYSNSPPPSSLPIPKFSLCSRKTVLLDLPNSSASDINFRPIARSAPPSPTRDQSNFSSKKPIHCADSATMNLRRILNLDIADK